MKLPRPRHRKAEGTKESNVEMNAKNREIRKHLRSEDLESLALARGRSLPERISAHAAECPRCRREVEELHALHERLRALAPLQPAIGFSDRVMRRVHLPLPWRARAVQAVHRHRLAAVAAVAGLGATIAAGLAWVARYPELTPVTVAAFLVQRLTAAAWSGVMQVGRLLYGSGIPEMAREAFGQVTPGTAFVAVATVTVVGLGALRIFLSLMTASPSRQPNGG